MQTVASTEKKSKNNENTTFITKHNLFITSIGLISTQIMWRATIKTNYVKTLDDIDDFSLRQGLSGWTLSNKFSSLNSETTTDNREVNIL